MPDDASDAVNPQSGAIAPHHLTAHLHNLPLAVVELSLDGVVSYWSPAAAHVFGWDALERLGKIFWEWDFVHKDDRLRVQQQLCSEYVDRLQHGSFECRHYAKVALEVDCQWVYSVVSEGETFAEEPPTGSILLIAQDVTEQRSIQRTCDRRLRELSQANRALQTSLKTLQYQIIQATAEQQHTEIMLQNLVEGTAGVTGEAFFPALVHHLAIALDVTYAAICEWQSDRLMPLALYGESFQHWDIEGLTSFLADTLSEPGVSVYLTDLQTQQTDLPLFNHLQAEAFVGIPLPQVTGEPLGYLFILNTKPLTDLFHIQRLLQGFAARAAAELERQHTTEALQRLGLRMQNIAANMPGMLYQYVLRPDRSSQILYASPRCQELFEIPAEVLQRDFSILWQLIHPDDQPRVWQSIVQSADRLEPWQMEYRAILPSGQQKWLQGFSSPQRQTNGDVIWDGVVIDVSDRHQAEQQLQQLATLVENSNDAIFMTDLEGHLLYLNSSGYRLLGINPSVDFHTLVVYEFYPLVDQPNITLRQEQVYQGLSCQWEGRVQNCQTGIVVPVLQRAFPIRDPYTQDIVACTTILSDLTELKRVEADRIATEQQLWAIASNIPGSVYRAILHPDGSMEIRFISEGLRQLGGLDPAEAIANPQRLIDMIHPDDRDLFAQQVILGKQTLTPFTLQYRIITPSGQVKWVQDNTRYTQLDEATIIADGVVLDVSDHKQASAALQASEKKYRDLVETSQDLIFSTDAMGCFTFVNQAARTIYGYEPEEMLGRNFSEFLLPEVKSQDWIIFQQILSGEPVRHYETIHLTQDKKRVYLMVNAIALRDETGAAIGTTGTATNITLRKQVEEQLKASLAEKDLLIKEVHHRVKNNLQVISSIFALQASNTTNAQVLAILDDSQNRISSMALVHECLYQSENLAKIDFASYIHNLMRYLFTAYNVNPQRIHLHSRVTPNITLGLDLAIPCGLLINELVTNALKHGFPNHNSGEIWLEFCGQDVNHLRLIVADNGVGLTIPIDVEQTPSLGLRLVRALVRQLRGTLTIRNQPGVWVQVIFPHEDV